MKNAIINQQAQPGGKMYSSGVGKEGLPLQGKVKRFLLTSAQNNTRLHNALWENLHAFAESIDARVMVGSFTYNKMTNPIGNNRAKRKTSRESDNQPEWWDKRLLPYLCDERVELAPGLVWCGEVQILPTAVNPLSDMQSYTGRSSTIIPHPKFAVTSVASPKHKGTKFMWTTGTVTMRNYIQKKAGQKAEFHHGYGALVVEVDSEGNWYVRQLNASNNGMFYDWDMKVQDGKVTDGHRPEAIVWGDIHVRQLEPKMQELAWGKGGILDQLQPRHQIFHDVLDFRSQNHHDRDDPWKVYDKYQEDTQNVAREIAEATKFLVEAARNWCKSVVVCSNHDMALELWLKYSDFRFDPENAVFFLEANLAAYHAIQNRNKNFYCVEWAFNLGEGVKFLRRDERYIVCPDAHGGIELGMHGDIGINGARASGITTFAKTGRKCIVGHSHSAEQHEGAMRVGVMGKLDQGYNQGMSNWSHTNVIVYPNGKRTLFTIWANKARA